MQISEHENGLAKIETQWKSIEFWGNFLLLNKLVYDQRIIEKSYVLVEKKMFFHFCSGAP